MVKHGEFVKLCLHLKCVCVRVIKENVSTEMMVAGGGGGGQQQRALPSSKNILFYGPEIFCVQESQCDRSIVDKEGSTIKRN